MDGNMAANIDLFMFNVNKDVTEEQIKKCIKKNKNLDIIYLELKSYAECHTKSFRVQIKYSDYEKAI